MSDGGTRKLDRAAVDQTLFLSRYSVSLVVLDGAAAGSEYTLAKPSFTLGRGPGVDIVLADDSISRQHAALELARDGYRVRDMGSTNGIRVNGSETKAADLKHGDRISLGEISVQYIVEKRKSTRTYDLSEG